MIEYSKFYKKTSSLMMICQKVELAEYKELIQQLGYAHFDD